MVKNFVDFVKFRTLRSGAVFSQYYVVPDPSFDLDALGLAAAEREMDEEVVEDASNDDDGSVWEDLEPLTPLPSAPATPPPATDATPACHSREGSLSPLSSIPSTPSSARSRSPARSPQPRPEHAIKGSGRKRRRKEHGRRNRAKKRKVAADPGTLRDRQRHQAKRVVRSRPQRVKYDLDDAPLTSTGFRGLYKDGSERLPSREELLQEGFVYFPWCGRATVPVVAPLPADIPASDQAPADDADAGTVPLDTPQSGSADVCSGNSNDDDDVVLGVLAGRPSDGEGSGHVAQPTWDESTEGLASAIEESRGWASFPKPTRFHRRGHFCAQACGISHGGGQLCPANLKHKAAMAFVLMYLISLPAMIRIAHFGSSTFATWAPKVHDYYATTLLALLSSDEALSRNFTASVWACVTINFGPRTITFPHRDYANLPFGWCAITALGDYDPDKGGDLVLWDCKMIIRFPPGSTILIPSAILRHSNTRIARNERRYSVTQYSAGALFRWVAHGFQLDEAFYASLSRDELAKERSTAAGRWRRGRAMFSRLRDLVAEAEKKL